MEHTFFPKCLFFSPKNKYAIPSPKDSCTEFKLYNLKFTETILFIEYLYLYKPQRGMESLLESTVKQITEARACEPNIPHRITESLRMEKTFRIIRLIIPARGYSHHVFGGISHWHGAVMTDPGQAVAAGGEADTVHPPSAACAPEFRHQLPKRHLGAPGCAGWLFIHFFNVSREHPANKNILVWTKREQSSWSVGCVSCWKRRDVSWLSHNKIFWCL